MQQAVAGVGSGSAATSLSKPSLRSDGYYDVTESLTLSISAGGAGVQVAMDCILTIDVQSKKVVNVSYGQVRTSY
jgi:hypothetical protein